MRGAGKRRPWIRRALLALFVLGVGLLAGTPTGRVQVYRALFTIDSKALQAWAADRMAREPLDAALPVIFELIEERAPPMSFFEDQSYLNDELMLFTMLLDLDELPEAPESLLIRALFKDRGLGSEGSTEDRAFATVVRGTRSPLPCLRAYTAAFLNRMLDRKLKDPVRERIYETLRRLAREDPHPVVRRCAIFILAWRSKELDFFLDLVESEAELFVRGQILEGIHHGHVLSRMKPREEQKKRIVRALVRFWSEWLRSGPRHFCEVFSKSDTRFYNHGVMSQLAILRRVRDHPEDFELACLLPWWQSAEGPRSAEVYELALAILRERRSPQLLVAIAAFLCRRGSLPSELIPLARDYLGSESATEKRAAAELLCLALQMAPELDSERRSLLAGLLIEVLADPELRRFIFAGRLAEHCHLDFGLLLKRPEGRALFSRLAADPSSGLDLLARYALALEAPSPKALSPEDLVELLRQEPSGTAYVGRFNMCGGYSLVRGSLPTSRLTLSSPAEPLARLGPAVIPTLLEGLRACDPEDLSTLVDLLARFDRKVLERVAREPGPLGKEARALIGDERAVDQR